MDVSFVPLVAVYPIIVMATLWMFTGKFSLSCMELFSGM